MDSTLLESDAIQRFLRAHRVGEETVQTLLQAAMAARSEGDGNGLGIS